MFLLISAKEQNSTCVLLYKNENQPFMHSDKYVYTQAVPQTESELANAAVEADETLETPLFPVSGQGQKLEYGTPAIADLQSADCSKICTRFNVASKNFMDNSARLRSARSESLKPRKSVQTVHVPVTHGVCRLSVAPPPP